MKKLFSLIVLLIILFFWNSVFAKENLNSCNQIFGYNLEWQNDIQKDLLNNLHTIKKWEIFIYWKFFITKSSNWDFQFNWKNINEILNLKKNINMKNFRIIIDKDWKITNYYIEDLETWKKYINNILLDESIIFWNQLFITENWNIVILAKDWRFYINWEKKDDLTENNYKDYFIEWKDEDDIQFKINWVWEKVNVSKLRHFHFLENSKNNYYSLDNDYILRDNWKNDILNLIKYTNYEVSTNSNINFWDKINYRKSINWNCVILIKENTNTKQHTEDQKINNSQNETVKTTDQNTQTKERSKYLKQKILSASKLKKIKQEKYISAIEQLVKKQNKEKLEIIYKNIWKVKTKYSWKNKDILDYLEAIIYLELNK